MASLAFHHPVLRLHRIMRRLDNQVSTKLGQDFE
jgi:hypothetical protein